MGIHLCSHHCESHQGFPGAYRTEYDADGLRIYMYSGQVVFIYAKHCCFCGKKVGSEGFYYSSDK